MKCLFAILLLTLLPNLIAGKLLTYEGLSGPGKEKHIVFLASDHEYRSEESAPAIARILAKNFGFKCTVLFGLNEDGTIRPGSSNIPGMEEISKADLLIILARKLTPSDESMKFFDSYIRSGKPIVGLRTSTHAFLFKKKSKYQRYCSTNKDTIYKGGFGRQVLGEAWAGHYGKNNVCSTRLSPVEKVKSHPVMRGVGQMHVLSGAYGANPEQNSTILANAIVLKTMKKDSIPLEGKPPQAGIWVRTYKGDNGEVGRVFTSTHGSSEDFLDENFRRVVINGIFWTIGMELDIKPEMNIDFIGRYNPIGFSFKKYRLGIKPMDINGWDSPIWPKDTKVGEYKKEK